MTDAELQTAAELIRGTQSRIRDKLIDAEISRQLTNLSIDLDAINAETMGRKHFRKRSKC